MITNGSRNNTMQPFELLDRFELLEHDNENLSLLRRSYIDKDFTSIFRLLSQTNDVYDADNVEEIRRAVIDKNLYSIFRLVTDKDAEWLEDLRRATMEDNLHSVFRLVPYEDLRKFVLEDNQWSMWKLLADYTPTQFVVAFKSFFVNSVTINDDCFSRGQLQSKLWLVRELKKLDLDLGMVFLCAGWYATLATMMFEAGLRIDKMRSFDIDPSCRVIAETFNKPWVIDDWKFKSTTKNIFELNFQSDSYVLTNSKGQDFVVHETPDTIINTSCEHITDFDQWYAKIPKGKLLILQTNNYFEIEDHINCSASLEEFRAQCPMQEVMFAGKLALDKYTRYMLIGRK